MKLTKPTAFLCDVWLYRAQGHLYLTSPNFKETTDKNGKGMKTDQCKVFD
jgi:hypothetical protein